MRTLLITGLCLIVTMGTAAAAIPNVVAYQGLLTDASGNPVADGSYAVQFSFYADSIGDSSLWTEAQTVATVKGLFSVELGSSTSLDDVIFIGGNIWLGIGVDGVPMTPRTRITSVPYAKRSAVAEKLEIPETTRYLTIGGSAFVTGTPAAMDVTRSFSIIHGMTSGQLIRLYADLPLPDGAIVEEVNLSARSKGAEIEVTIAKSSLTDSVYTEEIFFKTRSRTSRKVLVDSSDPQQLAIENGQHCYTAEIEFTTPTVTDDVMIVALQIVYTIHDPIY